MAHQPRHGDMTSWRARAPSPAWNRGQWRVGRGHIPGSGANGMGQWRVGRGHIPAARGGVYTTAHLPVPGGQGTLLHLCAQKW
eukprot:695864-Pyramimonas_sp.AAC.1